MAARRRIIQFHYGLYVAYCELLHIVCMYVNHVKWVYIAYTFEHSLPQYSSCGDCMPTLVT